MDTISCFLRTKEKSVFIDLHPRTKPIPFTIDDDIISVTMPSTPYRANVSPFILNLIQYTFNVGGISSFRERNGLAVAIRRYISDLKSKAEQVKTFNGIVEQESVTIRKERRNFLTKWITR